MSPALDNILDRLHEIGFRTQRGDFTPFGERLPVVSAVAWEPKTAQLALIAEMNEDSDEETWRQLLFAASGLRHHLATDAPAAFGTPVVLAIVDDRAQRQLRAIADDLSERYLLFARVDLNLIHRHRLNDPEQLDDALAPLLPRCRRLLGEEISRAEVREFWKALADEVTAAAENLDGIFEPFRARAGGDAVTQLVADSAEADELPAPTPLNALSLKDFRSIREAHLKLRPATIIHGPNGGGKSSVLEAMELDWAGTSQRKPATVPADEYERHLPRNGGTGFQIVADGQRTTAVSQKPRAELARCVLTHEAVAALVSQSPEERYTALVATTGLEIPDLTVRIEELVADSKARADVALTSAGLDSLPRRNTAPVNHLKTALRSGFAKRLPATEDIKGREHALATASEGRYRPRSWPADSAALGALVNADAVVARTLAPSTDPTEINDALDAAIVSLFSLSQARREVRAKLDALISVIRREQANTSLPERVDGPSHAIPADLAVRWLSHIESLNTAAERFAEDAASLGDKRWGQRLNDYARALERTAADAPRSELAKASRVSPPTQRERRDIDAARFTDAGFSEPVEHPHQLLAHLEALSATLADQIQGLADLERDLGLHPARTFHEHAENVLDALCRFELARVLKQASPMLNASERIVSRLLQGRLAPAVRELVAAIVRFEWHFKPLIVPEQGRTVVLAGLATSQADLDARLLLNSAERTVLGLAWFLALHLLQPADRRQVLVLDDPTAAFDIPNEAGFISTLRAFVRLTRPAQVIVSTHNDATATILAEQLAPVDGWPKAASRLRVQRDAEDDSVVTESWLSGESRSLAAEEEMLGLHYEPASAPHR